MEIETYLEGVKKNCPHITEEALDELASGITSFNLPPKTDFIKAGEIQYNLGYVYSGLLRVFYIDNKGDEITVNFLAENEHAIHLDAMTKNEPSKFYFQTIEPSLILNIPLNHIMLCVTKYPVLERHLRIAVEQIYCSMFNRLEGFLFENAEERYTRFLNESPDLLNRIPVSQLCTYLGIKRQTLTRIRKKMLKP